jgi:hypothetical protein
VFGIYGDCLWLLGNIIYAFKISGSVVKSTIHPKGDFYLKSDCIQCILFGLTFYLAPTTMIGFQVYIFSENVPILYIYHLIQNVNLNGLM